MCSGQYLGCSGQYIQIIGNYLNEILQKALISKENPAIIHSASIPLDPAGHFYTDSCPTRAQNVKKPTRSADRLFSILSIKEVSCIKRLVFIVEGSADSQVAEIRFDYIFPVAC